MSRTVEELIRDLRQPGRAFADRAIVVGGRCEFPPSLLPTTAWGQWSLISRTLAWMFRGEHLPTGWRAISLNSPSTGTSARRSEQS